MSAAGRGPRTGGPEDYFTTPSWTVRRLLDEWGPAREGPWVEPSAGNGAIIRTVNACWSSRYERRPHNASPRGFRPIDWRAFEIRDEEYPELVQLASPARICNFLHLDDTPDDHVAVVIGNPPYSHAFEFLMQAHVLYPRAEIVLLLRVAFTASAERYAFMRHHMPDEFKLPERPSFNGEGKGDSADYAWMRWPAAWDRRVGATKLLGSTPADERSLDKGHRVVVVPPQREMFG